MPHQQVVQQNVIARTWNIGDICNLGGVLYSCTGSTTEEPPSADWTEIGGAAWGDITGTLSTQSDLQTALDAKVATTDPRLSDARTPTAHKTSHQNNGADEITVAGLSGLLADGQTPLAHKASHENGGADELSIAGLSGLLADGQTPLAHAASHKSGGSDAIKLDELAAPTDVTTLNASVGAHGLLPKLSGSASTFLDGTGAYSAPVAAAGDTSKRLTSGTSTIIANTCRSVVRRFTIDAGAHLVIAATGSLEITA